MKSFREWTMHDVNTFHARPKSANKTVVQIVNNAVEREADLHDAIFTECRRRGWIALHGSMSERTHRTAGEPDFVILRDGGQTLLVECKSRTGKLSPEQHALAHHAATLRHTVHVVRSMQEFLKLL